MSAQPVSGTTAPTVGSAAPDGRARLLTDTLVCSLTRAEARLECRTQGTDRDTPAERLADLIDFGLPRTHDDVLECRLWSELEIRSTASGEFTAALTELRRRIPTPLVDAVEDGLDRGDFHDCAPTTWLPSQRRSSTA
ncbi:hypothetical protein ACFU98_37995 [Streptomyces sp. NPDC057575]|uniref:hypothetical protein n=1 Tax=unclassified Streptomyces TaxID=2593676 RepID=UPI0036B443A3